MCNLKLIQSPYHHPIRIKSIIRKRHGDAPGIIKSIRSYVQHLKNDPFEITQLKQKTQSLFQIISQNEWFNYDSNIQTVRNMFSAYLQQPKTLDNNLRDELHNIQFGQYINTKGEIDINQVNTQKQIEKQQNFAAIVRELFQSIAINIDVSEIPYLVGLLRKNLSFSEWALSNTYHLYLSHNGQDYILVKSSFCDAPFAVVSEFARWVDLPLNIIQKLKDRKYQSYDIMMGEYESIFTWYLDQQGPIHIHPQQQQKTRKDIQHGDPNKGKKIHNLSGLYNNPKSKQRRNSNFAFKHTTSAWLLFLAYANINKRSWGLDQSIEWNHWFWKNLQSFYSSSTMACGFQYFDRQQVFMKLGLYQTKLKSLIEKQNNPATRLSRFIPSCYFKRLGLCLQGIYNLNSKMFETNDWDHGVIKLQEDNHDFDEINTDLSQFNTYAFAKKRQRKMMIKDQNILQNLLKEYKQKQNQNKQLSKFHPQYKLSINSNIFNEISNKFKNQNYSKKLLLDYIVKFESNCTISKYIILYFIFKLNLK